MSFCGYISGSICLTAYTMFHPGHANVQGDQKLLSTAMDFLEDLATDTGGLEPVIKMRNVLRELLDYAQAVTGPT